MGFVSYNANPEHKNVGDCTVRAISKALGKSWDETYIGLVMQGYMMGDMPSANHVWGAYLREQGFERQILPNTCPDCYTVAQFAEEHPSGTYILALSGHVVCVQNGEWFDTWDSGSEIPLYYWQKRRLSASILPAANARPACTTAAAVSACTTATGTAWAKHCLGKR